MTDLDYIHAAIDKARIAYPNAFSKNAVACSQSAPLNPMASIWISPDGPMMISMVRFI